MTPVLANSQNLAIHGYHNKDDNSYSLMENVLPLLVDEKFSPFLVTKGYHYTITTPSIVDLLRGMKEKQIFQKRKYLIANLMLVPGLVFALMYTANTFGLLDQIPYLYTLSQSWIAQFTFWLSMIGVVILWHDYFSNKTHPVRFPMTDRFTAKEFNSIKISGVRFEKYKRLYATNYLSSEAKEYLYLASTLKQVDTYKLFTELLQDDTVQKTIERAELSLSSSDFSLYKISNRTFPKYPIQSLRSLTIYALEEAIITGSQNIKPIHIFLSMARVYPSLKKVIKVQDSSIELLREAANYELLQVNPFGKLSDFDIQRTYYPNGGIGHSWIYNFSQKSKKYLEDITVELSKERERYGIGQESVLQDLIQIVERTESVNKALLIGPTGIGKSSIVKALAQKINWGDVPNSFMGKRVIKIGSDFIVNSSPKVAPEYFAKILETIDKNSSNIYFIDDLLSVIVPLNRRKTLSETQKMLIQFIHLTKSPVITTIHYSDYLQYIKGSAEIAGKFDIIEMNSIPMATTVSVLKQKVNSLEKKYRLYITIPAIIKVTEITTVTGISSNQPKLATDFLIELCKKVNKENGGRVTLLDSKKVVEISPSLIPDYLPEINLPTAEAPEKPLQIVDSSIVQTSNTIQLIEQIKNSTIGRSSEIEEIINTHYKLLYQKSATRGRYLIGGAPSSGKTHLIRSIIQGLYPEKLYILIDLERYRYVSDIQKLLFRYANETKISNNYDLDTALVFEGIEHLNPQTQQYLIDILQNGEATGQYNRIYRFRNCSIFATTRLGSEYLMNPLDIDYNDSLFKEDQQRALLAMRAKFHPTILDNFDYITMLKYHSVVELSQIVEQELESLAKIFMNGGFLLEWERAVPQLVARNILESKISLSEIKEIVHDIGNSVIQEMVHSNSGNSSTINKTVMITQTSLLRQLRENKGS